MVDKSQRFITLVRVGYFARGLTYFLLGWLALETANRIEGGNKAVFAALEDWSFGEVILWVIAVGLVAYAAFKFLSAIADIQHRGTDKKGILKRIGDAASGVAYSVLAYAAYQYATGSKERSSGDGSQEYAGTVLSMDLGGIVLGLVGLGFLVAAVMQAKSSITGSFLDRVRGDAPSAVKVLGRVGLASRAVVFALMGWSLVKAAWLSQSSEVKGLGQALISLRDEGILYTLVCVGLMLFGLFSIIVARYRIIPDFGSEGVRPSFRA